LPQKAYKFPYPNTERRRAKPGGASSLFLDVYRAIFRRRRAKPIAPRSEAERKMLQAIGATPVEGTPGVEYVPALPGSVEIEPSVLYVPPVEGTPGVAVLAVPLVVLTLPFVVALVLVVPLLLVPLLVVGLNVLFVELIKFWLAGLLRFVVVGFGLITAEFPVPVVYV
jgi:hypothetical protein